jgi:hypothetical protein
MQDEPSRNRFKEVRSSEVLSLLVSATVLGAPFGGMVEMGTHIVDWLRYCAQSNLPLQEQIHGFVETARETYSRSFWQAAGLGLGVGFIFGVATVVASLMGRKLYRPLGLSLLWGGGSLAMGLLVHAFLWYDSRPFAQLSYFQPYAKVDAFHVGYTLAMITFFGFLVGWCTCLWHRLAKWSPPGE